LPSLETFLVQTFLELLRVRAQFRETTHHGCRIWNNFKVLYSFCSFQGGSRGYSVDWEITFFTLYEPIFVSRAYKNRDEVRLSPSAKGCSAQPEKAEIKIELAPELVRWQVVRLLRSRVGSGRHVVRQGWSFRT